MKSRYGRHSSVSEMLYELAWSPLSQRRHEATLILFYKIINGLAEVLFEGILIDAHRGTRTKHNKKLRLIGHSSSSMVSHFPPELLVHGTGVLSPKPHNWQIFICGILNQNPMMPCLIINKNQNVFNAILI